MKFWEVLKVAFGSLRGNKLRSSLTVLGIVIGIFSIISISTVITMLQNSISEGLSQLGKNTFQIQKFPAMQQGRLSDKIRNRKNLTIEEYYRLREMLRRKPSWSAPSSGSSASSSSRNTTRPTPTSSWPAPRPRPC